ncbi:PQQ-dependent sugar dehydrogenase [Jannaschia sp. S6380]|uniref:PQQ-dependent sugar dehydrogenase n=1 Tax=Jannaschia sp. S6380 TaxID=2926408 RepID=UPI001FF4BC4E|nr:PQQ-dependent sugar dehydrogenase [Jannaschia sp. S6380]MCK0167261.1 PQQ-dependent sugar dehydrogenase [Jannaschia sp. S6380]
MIRSTTVLPVFAIALAGSAAFAENHAPIEESTAAEAAETGTPPLGNDPSGVTIEEDQRVDAVFRFKMRDMPAPHSGPAVRNSPVALPAEGRSLHLSDGFLATLFASGLEHPRQTDVLPNGDVMVARQAPGHPTLLRDGDGVAEGNQRHAAQFNLPYGLNDRELPDGAQQILVADQDGIWIVGYETGLVRPPFAQPRPASDVPEAERDPGEFMDGQTMPTEAGVFGIVQGHVNRGIAITANGRLHVGVGTSGNIGVGPLPKASSQSFDADGTDQATTVRGMRNPSGLAVNRDTNHLWAIVQECDGVGNDPVPDYVTHVAKGGSYGFPDSYIGPNPQAGFAELGPDPVNEAIVPDLMFQPHSAAMDAAFQDGDMVPHR